MTTTNATPHRTIDFPETTMPAGANPALVGTIYLTGPPLFLSKVEGASTPKPGGRRVLEYRDLQSLGLSGNVLDGDVGEHLADRTSIHHLRIYPPMDMDDLSWAEGADYFGATTQVGMPV